MVESNKWQVRRSGQIRGPYPYSVLEKLAKIGRLKENDDLSHDGENWKSAGDFEGLFEHSDADLLLKDDERSGLDRRDNDSASEDEKQKRQGKERRKPESEEEIARRRGRTKLLETIKENREEDHFPFKAIFISLFLILLLGFVLKSSDRSALTDCGTPAAPGVNWDNCSFDRLILKGKDLSRASIRNAVLSRVNLQNGILVESNFSYTDLSGGNFKNANFDKAILKGVNLQSANLSSASLKQVDLSHADLRGAKLDNVDLSQAILDKAIWLDGSYCAKGSVGNCLPE